MYNSVAFSNINLKFIEILNYKHKSLKSTLSYSFIVRSRNYVYGLIVISMLFFIIIPNVHAAIIIRYEEMPIIIILTILLAFFINTTVEFGVVYYFLKSQFLVKKKLFLSVMLVNIVLFPSFQTIAYFLSMFYLNQYVFYVILFGFLMVLIEWVLYRLEFQKLFLKRLIPESPSLKRTILISSLANLASFSVVYLYPVIMMVLQYIQFPDLYGFSILFVIKPLLIT